MNKSNISDQKRTLIFINIVISCIAGSMLATALNTALPPIITDLHISVNTGQWLTSGFSLMMAVTMPLTAFLITRFPTKKLYCSAIFIFMAGLFLSAVSFNFPMMMLGRLVQAAGSGMMTSISQVIILTIFPPEKKGSAMGWYGLSASAAPIIAPTIAGILVDTVGWRMIFIATFVIVLISFVFGLFVFSDVLDTSKKKFDTVSFIMSAFAFGGVTLGLGNIGSYGFLSIPVLATLSVGLIAAVLFVRRQLQLDEPLLELRILKDKEYTVSVLGSMLLYFVMMGSTIILPLYIQQTLGLPATVAGLVMLPGSLVTSIVSPFAGKLYDKLGMRVLFISGAVFLTLSNALMFFVGMETSVWIVSAINIVRSVAIGCLMMPLVTWGASNVKPEMTAHATALLTSLRTIAGAIGSAVFVAIMTSVAAGSVSKYGEQAAMHGVNATFLAMAAGSALLVILAIIGTNAGKKQA